MSDILWTQLREAPVDRGAEGDRPRPRRVFVDREGRIVVGDEVAKDGERRRLSEVHPAVFAAP